MQKRNNGYGKRVVLAIIVSMIWWTLIYAETNGIASEAIKAIPGGGPFAVVLDPRFEFDCVVDGIMVTHDFIIQNKGTAPLSISDVKTSCGCTTVDYAKLVAPGEQGKISIRGNTTGYGGNVFNKVITVFTNDPIHEQIKLYLHGKVDEFLSIKPARLIIKGMTGDNIEAEVVMSPFEKYPFQITGMNTTDGLKDKISYNLKKNGNQYNLSVKNISTEPGRYRGQIIVETDSNLKPRISIPVSGFIQGKIAE